MGPRCARHAARGCERIRPCWHAHILHGRISRQVVFTIQQDAVADYELAAAFIKQQVRGTAAARTVYSLELAGTPLLQRYAAVFLQHEYGIFGGYRGELVVALVRAAGGAVPFVTTLHTVESVPSPMVQHTLTQLLAHSVAVTALSPSGCRSIDAWNTTVGAPGAANCSCG